VPAPGQGALAAQCRAADHQVAAQVATVVDAACARAVYLEREFLRVIEGGCSTPFGCHVVGNRVHLGIATGNGWAAHVLDLPTGSPEVSHESFIRAAVADCKPVELSEAAARALSRTLRAR
jgi:hydroxymethylbilane synthase